MKKEKEIHWVLWEDMSNSIGVFSKQLDVKTTKEEREKVQRGLIELQNKRFGLDFGNKLVDYQQGPWHIDFISPKLKKLLEDNKVTGWKSTPVTLIGKKKKEIKGYEALQILGRGDYEKTKDKKYWMITTKWDGSDMYTYPTGSAIIITPKLKKLLEDNNITGLYYGNDKGKVLVDLERKKQANSLTDKIKKFFKD